MSPRLCFVTATRPAISILRRSAICSGRSATVRSQASEWELDTQRVGVLGFSAGGHLVSTAATHFDAGSPDSSDSIEQAGSRPDLAIMIYPVISLDGHSAHVGSRKNLLGENPAAELVTFLSNQLHVTSQTPPTFLVHSIDDKAVPVENSLEFALALSANGVPFGMQVYEHGGHGYGLGDTDPVLSAWPRECGGMASGARLSDAYALSVRSSARR